METMEAKLSFVVKNHQFYYFMNLQVLVLTCIIKFMVSDITDMQNIRNVCSHHMEIVLRLSFLKANTVKIIV